MKETELDIDYINKVNLIAVDHPIGTKIGITEANDIVMYDSATVQSTDTASLNGNQNITGLIQYYYNGKKVVRGDGGDSIYAHYDSTGQLNAIRFMNNKYKRFMIGDNNVGDSLALITELGDNDLITPIVNKDWAGNVQIYTSANMVQKWFARREEMSDVIIPFAGLNETVDHIDVNWNQDFQVTYFSVVPIMYSGFTITELTTLKIEHSNDKEVTVQTMYLDTFYATIDTSSILVMTFQDSIEIQSGFTRDYVLETNGKYMLNGSSIQNSTNEQVGHDKNNVEGNIKKYSLEQNFPNPFNPKTKIQYSIPAKSFVTMKVYDIQGREVATLINEVKEIGKYNIEFDGTNLASGIYIYTLKFGDYLLTKKMVLVK